MAQRLIIRRGTFLDSVTLMTASSVAAGLDGILHASIVNATPLNVELVTDQGFAVAAEGGELTPNDLLIALEGDTETDLDQALTAVDAHLSRGAGPRRAQDAPRPRSVTAAARARPDLNLALVSVPAQHAAYECARALDAGLDVFCFSGGPTVEAEAALKARAVANGQLLMGPDCGTSIINGVALGFANAVLSGPVGIVGASGTGIQAITCHLDQGGIGISQAIGVGGRDLSREVGGLTTLEGLELLRGDEATEAIVVVAKSPDPEVALEVDRAVRRSGKPGVLAFPGLDASHWGEPPFEFTISLAQAAAAAARSVGAELGQPPREGSLGTTPGAIRGLFSGGTLRDEALGILRESLGPVATHLEGAADGAHVLVDLGDERFTDGRPHPMIDPSVRIAVLEQQARDPAVGVILLDLVLGYGAHPDPAGALAPAIENAARRRAGALTFIASICGTDRDPQDLAGQAQRLVEAGAAVTRSSADAAAMALEAAGAVEVTP